MPLLNRSPAVSIAPTHRFAIRYYATLYWGTITPMLYFGTSSWTGAGWETAFYPPRTKQADFLPFYASRLNSVEIDSTFYRIPTAKAVQQWRERTPPESNH